jgi:prophage regulatory protein
MSGGTIDQQEHLMTPETTTLITKKQLRAMVPYTPQHILRLEKKGRFPKRIQVGANRVAWLLTEIERWVADRVAARERPPT